MKQPLILNFNLAGIKLNYLPFLIFIITGIYSASAQSEKRGIAYGYHSPEDMEALSPDVTWWYNWSVTPESSVANVFQDYDFEFVPMAWNGNYNEAELRAFLSGHPETKYILAFNEPNFLEQANMTPSEAAAEWPRLEAIADEFDLEIVGPAVNFCGDCVTENGATYYDPFEYLDDFFEACEGCRVDHIAVHSYMNSVDALKWYIGEFKKYGKPIWLTEFNAWEDNPKFNLEQQMNYMIGAVDFLESDPDVFRYSWFIGRWNGINNYPHIELLASNGELTVLGETYKKMPVHDENRVVQIPATIEAEEYNRMSGIQIQKTADETGFANVGYIDAGDWLEYKIETPDSGRYNVDFRIASAQTAVFAFVTDGREVFKQTVHNTAGWQNWETVSNTVMLSAGVHTIQLQAVTAGFNVNWFEFSEISTDVSTKNKIEKSFTVFPNPGDGIFNIQTSENIEKLTVTNVFGSVVRSLPFSTQVDLSSLSPGIYSLRAQNKKGKTIATRKIILK
jgi:hypothetical protein